MPSANPVFYKRKSRTVNCGMHDCKVWMNFSLWVINEAPRHEDDFFNCNMFIRNKIIAKRGLDESVKCTLKYLDWANANVKYFIKQELGNCDVLA
jgi:hypothetical protein